MVQIIKPPKFYLGEVKSSYQIKENIECYKIQNSSDINKYIKTNFILNWNDRENFGIIGLSKHNNIIYHELISVGAITTTIVDPRIIFSSLLIHRVLHFICFHNHPSGSLNPSDQDRKVSSELKNIGELMHIKLIDNLIITNNSYYSFADEGIL